MSEEIEIDEEVLNELLLFFAQKQDQPGALAIEPIECVKMLLASAINEYGETGDWDD